MLLMPAFGMTLASVFAANSVAYIDRNGKTQQCSDYIPISEYSGDGDTIVLEKNYYAGAAQNVFLWMKNLTDEICSFI